MRRALAGWLAGPSSQARYRQKCIRCYAAPVRIERQCMIMCLRVRMWVWMSALSTSSSLSSLSSSSSSLSWRCCCHGCDSPRLHLACVCRGDRVMMMHKLCVWAKYEHDVLLSTPQQSVRVCPGKQTVLMRGVGQKHNSSPTYRYWNTVPCTCVYAWMDGWMDGWCVNTLSS